MKVFLFSILKSSWLPKKYIFLLGHCLGCLTLSIVRLATLKGSVSGLSGSKTMSYPSCPTTPLSYPALDTLTSTSQYPILESSMVRNRSCPFSSSKPTLSWPTITLIISRLHLEIFLGTTKFSIPFELNLISNGSSLINLSLTGTKFFEFEHLSSFGSGLMIFLFVKRQLRVSLPFGRHFSSDAIIEQKLSFSWTILAKDMFTSTS